VTLLRVLAAWHSGAPLPRHAVVVSFDDGYPSQYKAAYPVQRRYGWPGVLNLEVNDLGPAGIHAREVRALLRAGWEVDSHTVTHPDLTALPARQVRAELVGSRAWIRRHLHVPAAFFCYPAGRFDAGVERAVRAAGYRGATTERPGVAVGSGDPYALPRVRVMPTTTPRALLRAL
jgi:peptidoglycan/xylan/chitin deacetylase (PgdA/CDA1 family)